MNLNKLLSILSQSKLAHSSSSVEFPTSYCKVSLEMMRADEFHRFKEMTGVQKLKADFIGDDICHGVTFEVFAEDSFMILEGF